MKELTKGDVIIGRNSERNKYQRISVQRVNKASVTTAHTKFNKEISENGQVFRKSPPLFNEFSYFICTPELDEEYKTYAKAKYISELDFFSMSGDALTEIHQIILKHKRLADGVSD